MHVRQVVDSAFTRLTELMTELVVEQNLPIPRPFMKVRTCAALGRLKHNSLFGCCQAHWLNAANVPALLTATYRWVHTFRRLHRPSTTLDDDVVTAASVQREHGFAEGCKVLLTVYRPARWPSA